MSTPTPDDELLSILLINLGNAATTFGEGTPPHLSIKQTIEEHLQAIKAQGRQTNVTTVRQSHTSQPRSVPDVASTSAGSRQQMSFSNLAFRPKPST